MNVLQAYDNQEHGVTSSQKYGWRAAFCDVVEEQLEPEGVDLRRGRPEVWWGSATDRADLLAQRRHRDHQSVVSTNCLDDSKLRDLKEVC